MRNPVQVLDQFLLQYHLHQQSLLLALSGGPDSLCLFHCLLICQKKFSFSFHVAHVDHGWRAESAMEAAALQQLAQNYGIPFHTKKLDPHQLKGNLENACRQERQLFFAEICQKYHLQGVLLGHHRDDQAETVLKRLLEGSHWTNLIGLRPDILINKIRFFRPFLPLSKQDIREWLKQYGYQAFEDPTNEDVRFLRGRMRQRIIPALNHEFGKDVCSALNSISREAQELRDYFTKRITPILAKQVKGPLGIYLDLQEYVLEPIEIKYIIRQFCEEVGCSLSKAQIELAKQGLLKGVADCLIEADTLQIWIDRRKIFIFDGHKKLGTWKADWKVTNKFVEDTNWQQGWNQGFRTILPLGEYQLAPAVACAPYRHVSSSIGKWWSTHKIPAFLRRFVPVLWQGTLIYHEFLTGKNLSDLSKDKDYLEVKLYYQT